MLSLNNFIDLFSFNYHINPLNKEGPIFDHKKVAVRTGRIWDFIMLNFK